MQQRRRVDCGRSVRKLHDVPHRSDPLRNGHALAAAALQTPRLANSQQLPQHAPQVVSCRRDQVPLRHVDQAPQPRPPHPARLAHVRSSARTTRSAASAAASPSPDAPADGCRAPPLLLRRPLGPVPVALPLRLRDVRPQAQRIAQLQRVGRVIPLVRHHFLHARLGARRLQVLFRLQHAVDQRLCVAVGRRPNLGRQDEVALRSTTCSAL